MLDPAEQIKTLAGELGFAMAGIAPAESSRYEPAVRQWIDDGQHGQMHYLAEHLEIRLDPQKLLPGARSVIAVADAYPSRPGSFASAESDTTSAEPEPRASTTPQTTLSPRGRIARYAWGDDYHKVLKKRLHRLSDRLSEAMPDTEFRATVDTAPALEREHAMRAGLGWQAKNTMLIHPRHGSYFLLGLLFTTLDLPIQPVTERRLPRTQSRELSADAHATPAAALPGALIPENDHCANCTRCIDACPTRAIASEGYRIDASRCVSYLTIEHREAVPLEFHHGLRDWVAGCDICQEVCPYNKIADRHPLPVEPRYQPNDRRLDLGLDLIEVLDWSAEDRARTFQGSALKRIKLDMIRRNALIVAGNVLAELPDDRLRSAVERCLEDASPLVRETAGQVCGRIGLPVDR